MGERRKSGGNYSVSQFANNKYVLSFGLNKDLQLKTVLDGDKLRDIESIIDLLCL